jgi:hypothetical protein
MELYRPVIHGGALATINLGASLVGFAAYKTLGVGHQLLVQIAVAVPASVAAFALWYHLAHRVTSGRVALGDLGTYVGSYALAFAWFAVIFVPLHYVTQGYLTTFANIYNMWLFQTPTNVTALALTALAARRAARRAASG